MSTIQTDLNAILGFTNEYIIYENEIRCKINENEFNFSHNPTIQENDGKIKSLFLNSDFSPYTTTVGLFNEAGDLLMVGKLAQPLPSSQNVDTTIIVKYDI